MAPQIELPRIAGPANEADVMREQLEYLIEHAGMATECGCAECRRYLRARAVLLEIFEKGPQAKIPTTGPRLALAA